MVSIDFAEPTKKRKRKRNFPKTITFDEEVVPKHVAQQLLINQELEAKNFSDNNINTPEGTHQPEKNSAKKRKKQKKKQGENEEKPKKEPEEPVEVEENINISTGDERKPKKKKKKETTEENVACTEPLEQNSNANVDSTVSSSKTKLSIRARKRLKYDKLKEEKHVQVELSLQQKSLNYLSKWKHSRSDWKFEKLRQIWLQQNMLNEAKIPEKFWVILVEYLGNSKGKAKETILKSALKVVEDENEDQDSVKVLRARDLIQNLAE